MVNSMSKKFDALLFDLDGTLWYACHTIAKGWNETFAHFSLDLKVNAKDIESVAGHPFSQCVQALFPEKDLSVYPQFVQTLSCYEKKHMDKEGGLLYPGVKENLEKLSKDYKLYIVSNCSTWYLEMFLNFPALNLKKCFVDWDCFGLSSISKSSMITNMIKSHKLKNPVYIGDTRGDELAAKEANVPFIHASYGYGVLPHVTNKISCFEDLLLFE